MKDTLTSLYELVSDSRKVLFDFCETVKAEHFVQEVEGFGRGGSMRSLLAHIANSYQHWIAVHCFRESPARITPDSIATIADCRQVYKNIDELVKRLIDSFASDYHQEISSMIFERICIASPFKVFTHVTTHEFHHKGQILTISRLLGYTPVDTDVIR